MNEFWKNIATLAACYVFVKLAGWVLDVDMFDAIGKVIDRAISGNMVYFYDFVIISSTFVLSFAGTGAVYGLMKKYGVFDHPVERSNHSVPTPRGGGLAMVVAVLGFLLVVNAPSALFLSIIALTAVSFWDDIKPVPPRIRLGIQAVAVIATLAQAYHGRIFLDIVPYWIELPIIALAWMWFINLFNFMDGSDGLAASEAIAVSLGVLFLSWLVPVGIDAPLYSVVLIGSVLGFALWNWHPAKIFMGDAGSIPLGYLLGFVLIEIAGNGWWAAAAILPAYFVADASLVLLQRGLRGEKLWHAHSEHAYQRAIRSGMPHDDVARWVITLNIGLWVLAAFSTLGLTFAIACTLLAYGASMWLIVAFKRGGGSLPQQVSE